MSGARFSMKLKGRRLASSSALLDLIKPAVRQAAMVVQAGVQEASPVKIGTLRRSWNTGPAVTEGRRVYARVGTKVVYARYQNTRTRNRGFIKRGIDATKERAKQVLRDGVRDALGGLWERG